MVIFQFSSSEMTNEKCAMTNGKLLPSPVRDLHCLGQRTETQQRQDTEERTRSEDHERVSPVAHFGNQLDRDRRQQKTDAHLNRQRRADVLRIAKLCYARRKLRRIG